MILFALQVAVIAAILTATVSACYWGFSWVHRLVESKDKVAGAVAAAEASRILSEGEVVSARLDNRAKALRSAMEEVNEEVEN